MFVYVYGTLRKGGMFHEILNGCGYYGTKEVFGFKMVDHGAYPAALDSKHDSILCEKYKINKDILDKLDTLEGYPRLYDRVLKEGSYIYVMHPYQVGKLKTIESGDWIKYLNEKE